MMKCIEAPIGYERFQGHDVLIQYALPGFSNGLHCPELHETIVVDNWDGWKLKGEGTWPPETKTLPSAIGHEALLNQVVEVGGSNNRGLLRRRGRGLVVEFGCTTHNPANPALNSSLSEKLHALRPDDELKRPTPWKFAKGRYLCLGAPDFWKAAEGKIGAMSADGPWNTFTYEDGSASFIAGYGWEFDPNPMEEPKPREVYDHEAFARDVDQAIADIRIVVCAEWERSPTPQPEIKSGCTIEKAMLQVCLALVLRSVNTPTLEALLDPVLAEARKMLIDKNLAYGNSALNPVRVFSKASLKEQLLVRLDDKVSRLIRGKAAGEDVAADMLGYLILVRIAEKREQV